MAAWRLKLTAAYPHADPPALPDLPSLDCAAPTAEGPAAGPALLLLLLLLLLLGLGMVHPWELAVLPAALA